MKLGLFLLLSYLAYGVAVYGAPELKVMGCIAAFIVVVISMQTKSNKKLKKD